MRRRSGHAFLPGPTLKLRFGILRRVGVRVVHERRRRVRPRQQIPQRAHHRRRPRRLARRAGPLPAGRRRGPARGRTARSSSGGCSAWRTCSRMGICRARRTTSAAGPSTSTRAAAIRCSASSGCRRRTSSAAPATTAGITVPAIVDIPTGERRHERLPADHARPRHRVDGATTATGAPDLYPEQLRDEIDEVTKLVFRDVNNGVYRAGFAGSQGAYERAYTRALRPARLARASDSRRSATWSATPSPRPTSGCSPRWPASTPSITATSSATATS